MLKTRASRDFWLLAFTALLVLGAGLGLRDPWPADEPRFALVARQMVESGNWLFPHRGIELYSDKPPLFMWLQAATYTVLRDWRVAFLLPSLLASLGTLWCVYDLGRRLWTRQVGLYAAWALLFALQFTYQSKKAQIDPLVTFWITLANYGLLRHLLLGPNWKLWWLGWFAAGLGTVTKGVGVLALVMIVPALFAVWRGWPRVGLHLRDARFWLAPLAFAFAASLWLVPMVTTALSQDDPSYRAYLNDILFNQTANRYARSWDHAQPPWYFLGVMLTMWLPAMLALPWALPAWKRRLQRRDARYLLPLAWWLLLVVFFSIPSGKRDVYIMPALPMACLALAPLLPGIVRKLWAQRLAIAFAGLLAGVALLLGLTLLFGDTAFERRLIEQRGFTNGAHALAWLLSAIGAWGIGSLVWFGRRRAIAGLVSTLAGLWVLYGLVAYPLLNPSSSARELMEDVAVRIGPDSELALVAWKEQNLLMSRPMATTFGFVMPWPEQLRRGIEWQAQAPGKRWLLVQEPALGECVVRAKAELAGLSNRRRWWLVPADAVVPGCVPATSDVPGNAVDTDPD
ncbi:4-amino-4-deoxy-L-arabinose transferase-like glycosyltransferase [Luteimonas cucumeris]|uniref:4-amino-4-deoxy-L-arabinose transferase-like glycosyltransferase n=1 Tax=Luteimonas cucumeris TaxID=985012 RepID=A0A562L2J2_9GAMM|nr:glycosyltransferase family 39 protein [Luteimonas cucumeris]TWI01684.1 4-amino-4-deoxy-L-arabinose transferase-like glycosyltransferase [Luteimonas cucumeris]